MLPSYSQRMTNRGSAPYTDEAVTPNPANASPRAGRAPSLTGSILRKSLWLGVWVGAVTGPFLAFATLLLESLDTASPGEWVFGLVFIVWAFFPLMGVGAGIGFFVGAGSGAAVLVALWLEARSVWRVGAVVRVASAAVGSLVGGAIVLPVAAALFAQGAFAVPYVLVGSSLIAILVACWQGEALDTIRLRSAPLRAPAPDGSYPYTAGGSDVVTGRMPRTRALRIGGAALTSLLLIVLVELGAALRTFWYGPGCSGLGERYGSHTEFGLWPPQLSCVFIEDTVELVPRAVYALICVLALVAVGLSVAGGAGVIGSPERDGPRHISLSIVGSIGMALLALGLACVTAIGAFGPVARYDPDDPRSAPTYGSPDSYAPADDSVADGSAGDDVSGEETAPLIVPFDVPPPSTTYSIDELTTRLQALVDATFATAGPIVDPAIPPGTQTFAVSAGDCYVGDAVGQTARLEVGFDTADVEESVARVRALWVAEGYGVSEVTRGAGDQVLDPALAAYATGADPLPAASLSIRIYDGFLILFVEGLCVSR
jgi:hypothetical protein